ncbi:hypothetical protein ITP53_11595 [Nonomuraea sp. K274]|uniref:Uncharacterized protein n=1 Tax=Nonomuraea cypriaca TaxID=1187855 RepID=A0A931EYD6_9ACTN|nr:hypothetical protein [Nonomuraea cypriaca]MBF8186382.1 hypothetical protein [Nonomuraea cypriaca]
MTVPGQNATADRVDRMARFAAGARRLVVRAAGIGALVAAGWLFAVLFGTLTAAPAAANAAEGAASANQAPTSATETNAEVTQATANAIEADTEANQAPASTTEAPASVTEADANATEAHASVTEVDENAGQAAGGTTSRALTGTQHSAASDNAEAMAGRTVDGLNSQQDPGLPAPSTAGKILDTNGLVPNGGGSGPFGPAAGDVARSVFDPRLQVQRAFLACVLPPVVRTAADDPSFSPD